VPQDQLAATERVRALILRDLTRLLGRVRLIPSARGVTPALAHADLWRVFPRLARRVADLMDAGEVRVEEGVTPGVLRTFAELVEKSSCPRGEK
jgi:hypothetical protein